MKFTDHGLKPIIGECSKEELVFSWYLEELFAKGLILGWYYQNPTFILSSAVVVRWDRQLKTKTKEEAFTLLQPDTYTPDFCIKVATPYNKKLFLDMVDVRGKTFKENPFKDIPFLYLHMFDELFDYCFVDTKGTFSKSDQSSHSGDIRFPTKQKITWKQYGAYINRIVPIELFEKTFTPQRYLFTDIT